MNIYPLLDKCDTPLITTVKEVNDSDQHFELKDRVANWMAKAYGSSNQEKNLFHGPCEKVKYSLSYFNTMFEIQFHNLSTFMFSKD